MDKKRKIPVMSLRLFVTIMIILLSITIIVVYSYGTNSMYYGKYKDELTEKIENQSNIIVTNINENGYSIKQGKAIENSMYSAAAFLKGRVLIINSNYEVVGDSDGINVGSIIINEDIIKTMTKKSGAVFTEKDEYIQYICPVVDGDEVTGVVMLTASTNGLKNFNFILTGRNMLFCALIILFAILVASFIGVASVRGIRIVSRRMQVESDGHFNEKIPVKGFKEVRAVTESYNDTISKLMVIDSTRQEFVSNVSHELKTPITSMKVLADSLVQNDEADLEMYKEFMSDIVDEIDRESQIISDLLTLVKTDKKSAEMNLEETNINDLLEVILKRVTPIAKSRGIEITYESYRDVVATVDGVKLSLALSNIIENAVKYNVDNGWVKVSLNADHKYFHIKVADSGVGIPEDCKDKVFERFYRVDKARSRDTGGTGLGLAITKNAIVLHNGSIKLYSESGEGTTFTIKIPINYVENQ